MSRPTRVARTLQELLERDRALATLVERSLRTARSRTEGTLDPDLLDALDWPQDLDGCYRYLEGFVRWIPQQSDSPAWASSAPQRRCAQEVLEPFLKNAPEYTVEERIGAGRPNQPSGWLTSNQFSARALNPGLRPIAEPTDDLAVTSPADCLFQHPYGIDGESNIPATTVEGTHRYGNVEQLGRPLRGARHARRQGEEFGYFAFGGSDTILLFQEGVDVEIGTSGGLRRVGTPVGRCRPRS
ncbi:hypothetical protein [Kineococcus sp. G2]|uniref:hypothetical protein n=1 Tax=Kineococcus sp. G2 TaxID=3127484 RepID=UPI00301BDBBA